MIFYDPSSGLHNLGTIQLARSARAPSLARQAVDAWLGGGHPALEIAQLAASELVTNAVTYADNPAATTLNDPATCALETNSSDDQDNDVLFKLCQSPDCLRLGVTDPGSSCSKPSAVPLQAPSLNAERGRGLAIVQALSRNRWGSFRLPVTGGRVVWCHLDLNPTPAQIEELFLAPV
ncbi:ATP-binding protein [Nonomuraea sp. NPDC059007]|uniref:ATP-binding protein n=1 Tax=Nonomuraea sp. NPDC059007 TaxID=3346692 RepID=UPI00368336D1